MLALKNFEIAPLFYAAIEINAIFYRYQNA
jgi:hypothetical protein